MLTWTIVRCRCYGRECRPQRSSVPSKNHGHLWTDPSEGCLFHARRRRGRYGGCCRASLLLRTLLYEGHDSLVRCCAERLADSIYLLRGVAEFTFACWPLAQPLDILDAKAFGFGVGNFRL